MLNPSEIVSHFADAEAAAVKFVEDAEARLAHYLGFVEVLKADADAARKAVESVREVKASVEAAASVVPSLADVKALLDRVA